jgi:hypothetical protein
MEFVLGVLIEVLDATHAVGLEFTSGERVEMDEFGYIARLTTLRRSFVVLPLGIRKLKDNVLRSLTVQLVHRIGNIAIQIVG